MKIITIHGMVKTMEKREKHRKKAVALCMLGSALLSWPGACAAEAVSDEFSLEEYVVTASRMPVKVAETAANVTVISAKDIEKGGYTRLSEILGQTNVMITDVGNGAAGVSSVAINGDDRVLILVDGRKINREYFTGMGKTRVNLNQLPSVKNIERIEIVSGPASALYGSDAAGGVIHIITRKAQGRESTLSVQGGSWGGYTYTVTTEGKSDEVGYRFTAERRHQGDYEFKNPRTGAMDTFKNSYLDQDALTLRLDRNLDAERSLSFYWEHLDGKAGYGLMAPDFGQHHDTATEKTLENNFDVTYHWGKKETPKILKFYYNAADYDIYRNSDWNQADKFLSSRTTGLDWQEQWKHGKNQTLVGGLEWRQVTVDAPTDGIYNRSLTNKALFLENRWTWPKGWSFTAGTRYDDHNVFGGKQTSRLAANYEWDRNTNVYLSWGEVFKAPNVEELYGQSQAIGNPLLKPETGDVWTLGMNKKLGDDSLLKASVFRSHITNAITFFPIDSSYMYWKFANLQEQKRQGLDVSWTKKLSSRWSVTTGYSYVRIENKDAGGAYYPDSGNSQPNGYRLGIRYDQGKWNAALDLRGASGRDTAAYSSKSYWALDLMASCQVSKEQKIYAKVCNLTNAAYELLGRSGVAGAYPMAGRSFFIGMEQRL